MPVAKSRWTSPLASVCDMRRFHLRAAASSTAVDTFVATTVTYHEGPAGCFGRAADRGEVRSCARAPFEQHPFRLCQIEDRLHRVIDRVDETSRALRLVVAGAMLDNLLGRGGPVLALALILRFKRVAAYVEPYG
jgi:hypothetical protein